MAQAKFVRAIRDDYGYGKTAFYEYRGFEYMIHFCNNGCMDDFNIPRMHKEEQEKIDAKILRGNAPEEIKPYSGPDYMALLDMYEEA